MPGTVDDAARAALGALDTDAGLLRAVAWASDRFRELTTRSRFRSLREIGQVFIPDVVETGTITVSRDGTNITGNAAAQAVWTDDLVGRHIRAKNRRNWYEITSVVHSGSTVSLNIGAKFAEDAVSAGSYQIVQRFSKLDPRTRHLGKFVWMRFGRELHNVALSELDIQFPDRITVASGGPEFVAEIGTLGTTVRHVELFPYSSNSEVVNYIFWPHSKDLIIGDTLPEPIDPYVLREGILVDLYRYEMSKSLRDGKMEAAAIWRNQEHAQRTVWRNAMADAGQADKGLDDVTLLVRSSATTGRRFRGFNNTAQTEIFIRGNRP